METLEKYFAENPSNYGFLLIFVGSLICYGAYKNWGWIFQGDGRVINIAWISDTFGRSTARALMLLAEVAFDFNNCSNSDLSINGALLANSKDVISDLTSIKNSQPSKLIQKTMNFYGLGINLVGFSYKNPKEKILTVFAKSRKSFFEGFLTA